MARTTARVSSAASEHTSAGAGHVYGLFKRMASEVPAFQKYLQDVGVRSSSIRNYSDLLKVPPLTKANYVRAYPYHEHFYRGSHAESHILTSTSGSTGEPTYFGRSHAIDEHSALIHEKFLERATLSKNEPTLVVVCFGMGVWIGGIITYQAFQQLGKKGWPVSIITPGINKNEILKILRNLAPHYPQLILAGYPPFIKDVLDAAKADGITLSGNRIGIVCAAEAFTEQFRDYLAKAAHITDPIRDIMNIYGSADIGTMAFETPLSVLIRRLAAARPYLFSDIFRGASKTPTLAQFIPEFTHFAEENGELLISGDSAMPLIRYRIGDNGGVYTFDTLATIFEHHAVDLRQEIATAGIESADTSLPFVYVFERSDLSTTLYGLQIYPETIKEVLLDRLFDDHVTGRLTLMTKYNDAHDQFLEIHVELKANAKDTKALSSRLRSAIVGNLKRKNGEYRELLNFIGERAEPHITFWPHEDPLYFRRDIKQKWVVRPQE